MDLFPTCGSPFVVLHCRFPVLLPPLMGSLEGLEERPVRKALQPVSSVEGESKRGGFGPWLRTNPLSKSPRGWRTPPCSLPLRGDRDYCLYTELSKTGAPSGGPRKHAEPPIGLRLRSCGFLGQ